MPGAADDPEKISEDKPGNGSKIKRWSLGSWQTTLSADSDLGLLNVGWRSLRPGLIPVLLSQPLPSEN